MPAKRHRTRALTEVAFLAAASAVLFFLAQIPLVGPILCLGCPLPLTLMVYRHGPQLGLGGAVVTLILAFLMQGGLALLTLPFLFVGGALGYLLLRRVPPLSCIGWGGLMLGFMLFSTFWPYENMFAERWGTPTFYSAMTRFTDRTVDRGVAAYVKVAGSTLETFEKSPEMALVRESQKRVHLFTRWLTWMPVGIFFCLGTFSFWVYYLAGAPILRRLEVHAPPLPPLAEWRSPFWIAWGVIFVILVQSLPGQGEALQSSRSIPYAHFFLTNVEILLRGFYLLMGVAVLDHLLARTGLPWPLRRGAELIALALPLPGGYYGLSVIALVGLLDPWADFRSLPDRGGEGPAEDDPEAAAPTLED